MLRAYHYDMDPMNIDPTEQPTAIESAFRAALHAIPNPRVLELGTKVQFADSTHHAAWLPGGATHVMSDIEPGRDVDVVADAHDLAPFGDGEFDALIAVSTWEHLARPWIAAEQAARVLRPGGILYVGTHQTFPVHGWPSDYFRFSDAALNVLFGAPLFSRQWSGYRMPAQIIPPATINRWDPTAPAWLVVECFAIRAGSPDERDSVPGVE